MTNWSSGKVDGNLIRGSWEKLMYNAQSSRGPDLQSSDLSWLFGARGGMGGGTS